MAACDDWNMICVKSNEVMLTVSEKDSVSVPESMLRSNDSSSGGVMSSWYWKAWIGILVTFIVFLLMSRTVSGGIDKKVFCLLVARSVIILISLRSLLARMSSTMVESVVEMTAPLLGGCCCKVYSDEVRLLTKVREVTLNVETSTVSSNVNRRVPESASKLKLNRTGSVVSGVHVVTGNELFVSIAVTSFPNASIAADSSIERKVESFEYANPVSLFTSFKSSTDRVMVSCGG